MIDITKNISLYRQLKEEILNKIKGGNFKPGDRISPLRKLCVEYSISHITAEKAINELAQEGILYKRQGMGTFVKKAPPVKPARVIGLAIYNLDFLASPFFSRLVSGISKVTYKNGCQLEYYTTNKEYTLLKQAPFYIKALEANKLDGLLLGGTGITIPEVLTIKKFHLPVVLLAAPRRGIPFNCVCCDEFWGTCKAVEYLIELGHKRIAFLSYILNSIDVCSRVKAYKSILKKFNLKYNNKLLCKADYGKGVYSSVQHLLSLKSPPTAIITHDDVMAIEVIAAIKNKGLRVPEDISVIGFNDALNGHQPESFLTTIKIPIVKIGELAAEMLLKLIQNKKVKEKGISLMPELIIRKSCRRL